MSRAIRLDLTILVLAFAVVTLVAQVAGAPNLGTAMSFGQLAFGAALVFVLVRR